MPGTTSRKEGPRGAAEGCRGRASCPRSPQGASSLVLRPWPRPPSQLCPPEVDDLCVPLARGQLQEGHREGGSCCKELHSVPQCRGEPGLELEIDRQWPHAVQGTGPGPGVTLPASVGGNPSRGRLFPTRPPCVAL